MKAAALFCVLLPTLLFCPLASWTATAGDLNGSGEKKVTVATEIERGYRAIEYAHTDSTPPFLLGLLVAYDQILNANKQKNTDTDGFLLGANLYIAGYMGLLVANPAIKADTTAADIKSAQDAISLAIKAFRVEQKKLDLTDKQVADAADKDNSEKLLKEIAAYPAQ